jgi:branched-chain amino acid transport system permease protein
MFTGQLIIAGIVSGAIYALIAVGLVVIYKASHVLNFAHGHVSAVAAFVAYSLIVDKGMPIPIAIPIAIVVSIFVALLMERVVIAPLAEERPLTLVVATLAVSMILSGSIILIWGPSPKEFPPLIQGHLFTMSGIAVSQAQGLMVVTTLVVVGILWAFFKFTSIGIAMRAASENRVIASLLGVNLRVVSLASWGIGGALGAIAAVLVAPQVSLTPDQLTAVVIQGFLAVVLAGFTNIWAAVVGGFITGVSLNLFAGLVVSDMPSIFLLGLILVVLLIRPHGLFGKKETVRL